MNAASGDAMYCTQCGAPVDHRAWFCTACGAGLQPAAADTDDTAAAATATIPRPVPAPPPGASASGEPPPARGRRRSLLLVAAVVVVVAAAAIAFAVGHGPDRPSPSGSTRALPEPTTETAKQTSAAPSRSGASPTPSASTSTESAAQQAVAVDLLLTGSATARADVSSALADIGDCDHTDPTSVSSQVDRLQRAIAIRQDLLGRLPSTSFDLLPGADVLRADLTAAWTASIDADRSYQAWAQSHAQCAGGTDLNEQAGDAISTGRSQPAKTDFVARWSSIAAQYGLAPRTTTAF